MADTLHMTVGSGIGKILLDIAQEKLINGDIKGAIETYTKSLHGMTDEQAIMILRNKYAIESDEDGTTVNMTDDPAVLKKNAKNIYDWNHIISKRVEDVIDTFHNLSSIQKEYENNVDVRRYGSITDCDIIGMVRDHFGRYFENVGIHNIAAKKIANSNFSDLYSNGENLWEDLEIAVEDEDAEPFEYGLYFIVKYINNIRILYKDYMKLSSIYNFLLDNELITPVKFITSNIEAVVRRLIEYSDNADVYNHPMCDAEILDLKETIYNDISSTKWGEEYIKNRALENDIMDGYDAGWLSPDGKFFGANGPTSAMIHMNIAEQLFAGMLHKEMTADGVSIFGGFNAPEYWLEKHGWIKIHGEDCYGSFIGKKGEEPTPDYPYSYCPTPIQIKMICKYADQFHGGKFYTEANALGRSRHTEPFTTYAVRQMDDIRLHEIFGL